MTFSGYRVKVPGKLLIAGEYAVLEPKQQAVVMAVNRYVTAYIEPSRQNQLSLPQLGLEHITWDKDVQFNVSDSRLNFIQNSIAIVNQFLSENSVPLQPFHLIIKSELDDPLTGRKYGMGSSAAVVAAVISAMFMLYGSRISLPTLDQVFKLAALAHLKTQKNGSGVDIAASIFGGILVYSSFQPSWVLNELDQGVSLSELIEKPWPNLSIRTLTTPSQLKLCVGWTKEAASTAPLIKKVQNFRDCYPQAYTQFLKESSIAVARLIQSFERNDESLAVSSLLENRKALLRLAEKAEIMIETTKLKDLCSIAERYGSGKSSGAGGGDCGIALVKREDQIEKLFKAWLEKDINPLKVTISQTGVSITESNCEPSLEEYFSYSYL
ncbi:phosphomevalonate kinase [Bacillus sp. DX4.1]|uniref:phosphomevalonate kinase n=1 Tax=Bacillus sp. DX4.1 TaxID=3055867 RepID=UPI0025A2D8C6|nr:phosphomevalonate kinase [Bacillus sp. DX4.1]MDM5190763.1 phosphomevalonate kinase [Bacillus sp. DX4.1]